LKLAPVTRPECRLVRKWRNEELQFLRTPHFLTEKMQDDFYDRFIDSRDSPHRYFSIVEEAQIYVDEPISLLIGMGGLTNIDWVNGTAEISLIIGPKHRGKGKGQEAVDLLLAEGFNNLRLDVIYGEVYNCGNRGFWEKVIKRYGEEESTAELTGRKYWNGKHWGSMWFCIRRSKYEIHANS